MGVEVRVLSGAQKAKDRSMLRSFAYSVYVPAIIRRMIRRYLPKSTEELIHWYERYVSPIALVFGFLLDNYVLLDRVDVIFGNILLLSYLTLAGVAIVLLNLIESGRIQKPIMLRIVPFLPVVIQLFFGALFSGYLSLYSRSAGVAVSWVFVLALAFLLLGNERFRNRYQKLPFQLSIYFVSLYSFLIFFLPLVLKRIGPEMFLLSGILSIVIIGLVMALLRTLMYERYMETRRTSIKSLVALVVLFNVLYFSNLIPPLPLALKEGGVYHHVERREGSYTLLGEQASFFVRYLGTPAVFRLEPGGKAYVFAAVFAPSGLSTVLRHQWQFYNTATDRWETRSDIRFTINGGRDGGYRGYSEKYNPDVGSWRVNVLTEHGQIVGRIRFTVVSVAALPEVIEETR